MILTDSKKRLLLLTIFAIALVAIVLSNDLVPVKPFELSVQCGVEKERILLWEDSQGDFYAFLPGYAQMETISFVMDDDTAITLDGRSIYDGMSCEEYACDVQYDVTYRIFGKIHNKKITFLQSDNMAAMFIDTSSRDMLYIHENKRNEESGTVRVYEQNGDLDCSVDQITVQGRGNVSWTDYEKKSYTITLPKEENLLEMGSATKWILLANASDNTHMRNKIVFDFAKEIGFSYSPDCKWVNVYLNGEYNGLYLLSEKNEVHSQRVDIAASGSFLVSLELEDRLISQNLPYVLTDHQQALRIRYPVSPSDSDVAHLRNIWQTVENAILADDGIDPDSGKSLQEIIDVESWVLNYLIDEVFGNLDGFKASRYFYMDSSVGERIYAGPIWDYDKSIGNDTDKYWNITNPDVFVQNRYVNRPGKDHLWALRLYERTWFQDAIKEKFSEIILPKIGSFIEEKIACYVDKIRYSAEMDNIRWPKETSENFDESVSKMQSYLKAHRTFLKSIWVEEKVCYQVRFTNIDNDMFYSVPSGQCLQEVPEIKDTDVIIFQGWFYSDTHEPFDITMPVTENIELYAVWEDKPSKKLRQIEELLPIGMIAVIGVCLLLADFRKIQRSR